MTPTIVITGAGGFVGKHMVSALSSGGKGQAVALDRSSSDATVREALRSATVLVHLAAANRPADESDFATTNVGFSQYISDGLGESGSGAQVVFASSIHAAMDTPYGRSKLAAESVWRTHAERYSTCVDIFRFPNVFGKWCRPNYNSAVATFAHNIARDLPITVSDPSRSIPLIYIDDVIAEILGAIESAPPYGVSMVRTPEVTCFGTHTLGEIVSLLESFRSSDWSDSQSATAFEKQLRETFVSYLPESGAFDSVTRTSGR